MKLELSDPPREADGYLVADWVELSCALDQDGAFSSAELAKARGRADDFDPGSGDPPAETDDSRFEEGVAVWQLLSRRAKQFGETYPFEVVSDDNALRIAVRDRSEERDAYLFLLCAASLEAVRREHRHLLTQPFERTTAHVISAVLGDRASVEIFGTTASEGRYTGSLAEKVKKLSEDLGAVLLPPAAKIKPQNSGDGGLDIVGRVTFDDEEPARTHLWFVQCACGTNWPTKWAEVDPKTWGKYLSEVSAITPVTAIPYAFRNGTGRWYDESLLAVTVLIDRLRYLRMLEIRSPESYSAIPANLVAENFPALATAA